jgi:hypothetical protein
VRALADWHYQSERETMQDVNGRDVRTGDAVETVRDLPARLERPDGTTRYDYTLGAGEVGTLGYGTGPLVRVRGKFGVAFAPVESRDIRSLSHGEWGDPGYSPDM